MWGLGKLTSIWLAAPSSSKNYSPSSPQEIVADFQDLYASLGEKAPVHVQQIPTIRFSFVTPPPKCSEGDWRDYDVFFADADLCQEENDNLMQAVAERHGTEKPLAVYLPGLDGFGISGVAQFNDLSRTFELWRMSVRVEDRSSFSELLQAVSEFCEDLSKARGKPIYVIGESFGGLLAPNVALKFLKRMQRHNATENGDATNPIHGLIMVNPATSFEMSSWDVAAPLLTNFGRATEKMPRPFAGLPSPYAVVGGLALSALVPSRDQRSKLVESILKTESLRDPSRLLESLQGSLDSFRLTGETLPPDLVEHRIKKWMIVGSSLIQSRLEQVNVPTLVVVGRDDKMIASSQEAKRLKKLLPQCETLEVRGAGHFVLDDNVNLTEAILFSEHLDPFRGERKPYDPILDWKLPEDEIVEKIYNASVKPLETSFSPIWMSTDQNGVRSMGLENLPKKDGRPLLFVSNHQLLGVDLNLLVSTLLQNNITVRGLAHPIIFQQGSQRGELGYRTPGLRGNSSRERGGTSNFQQFGAVMVTPRNYYRLLESGQNVLLFPGGVREVFHGRDEAYQLFWPGKVDFVRPAAKFNATIVPISAVGIAESLNFVLDPSELGNLPLVGERAKEFARNVTAARFDTPNEDEYFLPPVVAPGLPSRNYFVFGKAVPTTDVNPKDKVACQKIYYELQEDLQRGFHDILRARKKDPYKDAIPRLTYERLTGNKAPTFPIAEVNTK